MPRPKNKIDSVADASRVQRKRIQNRISQQCVREKQAAHIKQLEALVEMMKTRKAFGDESNADVRYEALMNSYANLVEENKELRDALLDLRKTFFSISTAADGAADHRIFERVIGEAPKSRCTGFSIPNNTEMENEWTAATAGAREEPGKYVSSPQNEPPAASEHAYPMKPATFNTVAGNLENLWEEIELPGYTSESVRSTAQLVTPDTATELNPPSKCRDHNTFPNKVSLNDWDMSFLFGASQSSNLSPFLTSPSSFAASHSPGVHGHNATIQKIEEAANLYLFQKFGVRPSDLVEPSSGTLSGFDHPVSILAILQGTAYTAAAAIELLCRLTGMTQYIYGVGANLPLEMVMRWRMFPTTANRNAIPEPFRPTPLQFSSKKYPLPIDFIQWPSIRDQLILQAGSYDLEQVIRDLIRHTVVEVPDFSMSLNTLNLFSTKILSHESCSVDGSNPGNSRWPAAEPDSHLYSKHSQETLRVTSGIVRQLSQIIQSFGRERMSNTSETSFQAPESSVYIKPKVKILDVASKYGLDKFTSWKLSKDFADSHPALDCTSGQLTLTV